MKPHLFYLITIMAYSRGRPNEAQCGVRQRCTVPRVVEGKESCADNAPWHAIIERKEKRQEIIKNHCGGSLVSSKFVVSAAHCFWKNQDSRRICEEPFLSMTAEECHRLSCHQSSKTF